MKRVVIGITGGTVTLVGVALLILPGPALLVIPAGLAILATEFLWARKALRRCKYLSLRMKRHPRLSRSLLRFDRTRPNT